MVPGRAVLFLGTMKFSDTSPIPMELQKKRKDPVVNLSLVRKADAYMVLGMMSLGENYVVNRL